MHPSPVYRPANHDESLTLASEMGFGMLAVSVPDTAPMISHIPFLLSNDGTSAELHLVRSNPIARALSTPLPARLAIQGPHSYISPDWYGTDDQVPTWNYLAIHLTGRLFPMETEALTGVLERLSEHFEARLAPKPEWLMDKLSASATSRMMRQIVPVRFEIESVESTWKLGQDKLDSARLSAADHVATYGIGLETRLLSAMMRKPPK